MARHTYNARSKTAVSLPSFKAAWKARRWCLIPVQAFFEPNYESGRAERWRIALHKPGDEKRSVVAIPPVHYRGWLYADEGEARALLRLFPADEYAAQPAPRPRHNPANIAVANGAKMP